MTDNTTTPDRNAELRAWIATMRADFPAARVAYFDGPGGVRGDATLEDPWTQNADPIHRLTATRSTT